MISKEDAACRFYKIMHSSFNTTQRLRIPRDFEKFVPKEDNGAAVLKVGHGRQWEVNFCKSEDGTFLQEGWPEFLGDNSLGDYEVLVFSHNGNMCFDVQIFDKTGCEKQDPCCTRTNSKPSTTSSGKRRVAVLEPSTKKPGRRCKKLFNSSGKRHDSPPPPTKFGGCTSTHMESGTEAVVAPERTETKNDGGSICTRVPTEEDKAKVWEAANSFTSSHPHFIRPLNESIVSRSYVVPIPNAFSKANFPRWKTKVALEDHRGKSWAVNLVPVKFRYFFCGGWSAFVHDNQLKAGDICVFELVGDLKMHVHIFRVCQA